MEEEKEGISFGDICRIIFSQKWLALIIAVAITVAGTLALYFGYNKIKEEYVVDFTLVLPGDDAILATYPDGHVFNYNEFISQSTLSSVVSDGEGKYDGIEVEKMLKGNGISVSENVQLIPVGEDVVIQRKYSIKVSAKYFRNADVARDFLTDVANYPCKYISNLKIDYDSALKQFKGADGYLKQIEYLNNQINFIQQKYNELIEDYKSDFVVSDGKTLKDCLDSVTAYAASYEFSNLSQELNEKKYVMNESSVRNYQLELMQVTEDYNYADFVLKQMINGNSEMSGNAEAIRLQAEKVAALQRKQDKLTLFSDPDKVTVDTAGEFAKRLDGVYRKVVEYTNTLQSVSVLVYKNYTKAFFDNSNVITSSGHMGIAVSVVGSLIIGLVVAAIVAYIVGWSKLKKVKEQAEAAGEENPVEENGKTGQQA